MNKNVKIARIRVGLTQKELCKLVGIGVNTLVEIEKDNYKNLKYPTMIKLATALNTTVRDLFFSDEE